MSNIEQFTSIDQYNKSMGLETLHPLVAIIDYSKATYQKPEYPEGHCFGYYTVFLKDQKCGDFKYGRNYYDYQEGTLVFLAPGQEVIIENRVPSKGKGWALMFHPDLLKGTSLGRTIDEYTFFSYEVFEALHLSDEERRVVLECFKNIQLELSRAIDKHSKNLIVSNIELFLSYCTRFYDRQFITRSHVNSTLLSRFHSLLDDYFSSDMPQKSGLPTVKYCASKLNLSANYLGDLLKKETGKSAQEHVQLRLIDIAKERLNNRDKSVSEVAYELGFEYPQYFSRLFKKRVGCTPNEFRSQIVV
ncbi:MAG: helix-turn-helix domain-containing protein [Bacteroidales bacterium]